MKSIALTQRLKSEVSKKLADYEKELKFEQIERMSLEATIKRQRETRWNVEKKSLELAAQVAALTQLNESLSQDNGALKTDLQQSKKQIASLTDDLNSKDIRLNDLEKECQKLQKEKDSFNKKFNDRLRSFVNHFTFSEDKNCELTSESEIEKAIQIPNGDQRLADIDRPFIQEDGPSPKRQKTNSSDTSDNSTNDQNDVLKDEPVTDTQTTQTIDETVMEGN